MKNYFVCLLLSLPILLTAQNRHGAYIGIAADGYGEFKSTDSNFFTDQLSAGVWLQSRSETTPFIYQMNLGTYRAVYTGSDYLLKGWWLRAELTGGVSINEYLTIRGGAMFGTMFLSEKINTSTPGHLSPIIAVAAYINHFGAEVRTWALSYDKLEGKRKQGVELVLLYFL